MATFSSKLSRKDTFKPSVSAGHHATVICNECSRSMVPRVVVYYGRPTKSVCPFCGATFARFPNGLQKFFQRFHTRNISLTVLKKMVLIALSFVSLILISDWVQLPDKIGLFAFFGAALFGLASTAELLYQCVEYTAAKFSHESNYYWAFLTALAMIIAVQRSDLSGYVGGFFLIILLRGLIAGLIQFRRLPD